MAGLLSSYSDSTCNMHNALQNISEYACGVTFSFKSSDDPPDMHYAVVSLQECCAKANQPVLRIPDNTGCEIQFCNLPAVTSSYTSTIFYGYATGSGTAAQTPAPSVTEGARVGWPENVESCMKFVYEGDLPDDIANDISNVDSWCVARMYDDELPSSEVSAAVTASPAPASWTSAAVDQWDVALSSESAASASATASSKPTSHGCSRYSEQMASGGMRIWAVAVLMSVGLVAAL
ncbi:hypothetical protein F4781DRAFT_410330 [Annulohypoxylon bovei var. microspora]|nr:hypothetical protein F4781DRAFT_410330 [Annulohypoxylon bovei var. microspora]